MVDALALEGDEGRANLRKVAGSWLETIIRKYPNGVTQYGEIHIILFWIHRDKKRNVAKWNISVATGKENESDSVCSGERKRNRPNRSNPGL